MKMDQDFKLSEPTLFLIYVKHMSYSVDRKFITLSKDVREKDTYGILYLRISSTSNSTIKSTTVKVKSIKDLPLYYRPDNIVVFISLDKFISVDYDKDHDPFVKPPSAYNYYEVVINNESTLMVIRKVTFSNLINMYDIENKFVYIDYNTIAKASFSNKLLKMLKVNSKSVTTTKQISKAKYKMRKSLIDSKITENVDTSLQRFTTKK
jgi:hypothetical protein